GEDEKVAGFSMVQLIETSLISGHFANKSNNAYIDIFSCKYYEPSVALEFTKKFFEAKEVKMHYVLRG
ncbi:MAG: S-adenosylmethionine decarboxylase, partial [Candidatus Atribacteria bacterium]|nr:S-adenosylmethionine decarboxylase [Candidatus Atribacteria bacterium]